MVSKMLFMNDQHQTAAQRAFNFTPPDLIDNRQGRLSEAQLGFLRRRAATLSLTIIGILAVLGALSILSAQASSDEVPVFLFCLTMPALITLVSTVGITEMAVLPRLVSKRTGQIHLAAAPADYTPPLDQTTEFEMPVRRNLLRGIRPGRSAAYSMIIDDVQFRLSRDEFYALQPAVYTIYFVPTLNRIVAVEPILETPAKSIAIQASSPSTFTDDDQDIIRA
jgi:hypothetical protein